MATRKPKPVPKQASGLLEALKFISVAQHSDGTPLQTHCRISEGTVIGFDGGLAAGHLVDETFNVCPHTQTFIAALSKCEQEITLTELDNGKLSVKSGKFKALVPCLPFLALGAIEPDPPIATLTDSLKTALAACLPLVSENQPEAFKCGVLLQAETAVSTNRHVIIEAWHGIDLPPGILIPKASAVAIAKSSKELTAFGFSENSATFFFKDNSFIRTQLLNNDFPRYGSILNIDSNPSDMPAGFYEALDKITPFIEDHKVYFIDGKMSTHPNFNEGTTYEVDGLPNGFAFNSEYLKIIKPHAHRMHFGASERGLSVFFGENVRGGIMKIMVNGS